MKKLLLVFMFCIFSLSVMAQTRTDAEIGVVTGWEKYTENRTEFYGVTFTNPNSFPVIVTAELWNVFLATISDVHSYISNTSSFILNPGEKYLWKISATVYSESTGFKISAIFAYVKYKAFRKQ